MDNIHWELSVLSRAVAYKNLSGASTQVGLSQPQLSRIIAKLEKHLNVVLLDRTTKRNAAWTPTAFRLVEVYSKTIRSLEQELGKLTDNMLTKHIHIGALEGLIPTVLPYAKKLIDLGSHTVDIQIYDLNQLEEHFFRGEFDLLFVPREPGRKKFKYSKVLGYQVLEKIDKGGADALVMSAFEYATQRQVVKQSGDKPIIISNSLAVRKLWFDQYGGQGVFPSSVTRQKPNRENIESVYLLGNDTISAKLWEKIIG